MIGEVSHRLLFDSAAPLIVCVNGPQSGQAHSPQDGSWLFHRTVIAGLHEPVNNGRVVA